MDINDNNYSEDIIKLKSGRRIYANQGIVGIGPDLTLSEGYDGGIPACPGSDNYEYDENHLTKEDAIDLVDQMIARCIKLKVRILNAK